MKVARLVEKGRMELTDEPIPKVRAGKVVVRMAVAGICGSDLHYFLCGGLGSKKTTYPKFLGHEPAGTVEAVMYGSKFEVGDRAAIDPAVACGACRYCEQGLVNLCESVEFMGANGGGAFSDYVLCDERQLVKIPDRVTFEQAAMLEPFGVALHAVRLAGVHIGSKVAILGVGPIGMCIAVAARLAGASKISVMDPLEYRCNVAVGMMGADEIWEEELGLPWGDECRAEICFDAAGTQKSVHGCFEAALPGGKVVLVGIPTYDFLEYNPHVARTKELTVINVRRSRHTLKRSLDLLVQRELPLGEMITHKWPLNSIQHAFETAGGYRDEIVKGVIAWEA